MRSAGAWPRRGGWSGAGVWGARAGLLVANSEFAMTEANGKIYVLGALTGSGRGEPPLPDVYIYDPALGLAPAAKCTGAADCASGFCVDGVCCDAACSGACTSVSAAASCASAARRMSVASWS